jgi:4-methoxybenzoate monooxygenase (O-demethylating)
MFLGAANQDPRRWATPQHPDPHSFGLARDPSRHVGFGMGIHRCIGQHVARLEAEAVITARTRRGARIELTGMPRRHHNNTLRGWAPSRARAPCLTQTAEPNDH